MVKKICIATFKTFVYIEDTKEEIIFLVHSKITNNICELKARYYWLKAFKREEDYMINIYTDFEYVINSITNSHLIKI